MMEEDRSKGTMNCSSFANGPESLTEQRLLCKESKRSAIDHDVLFALIDSRDRRIVNGAPLKHCEESFNWTGVQFYKE